MLFGHSGDVPGYQSELYFAPTAKIGVVVLRSAVGGTIDSVITRRRSRTVRFFIHPPAQVVASLLLEARDLVEVRLSPIDAAAGHVACETLRELRAVAREADERPRRQ